MEIRGTRPADRDWIRSQVRLRWGSEVIMINKKPYQAELLPGLIAVEGEDRHGFICYNFGSEVCTIVYQASIPTLKGTGTELIHTLNAQMRQLGARTMRVIVSNDNISALWFYQARGFSFEELRVQAIDEARYNVPKIPIQGDHKLFFRDELQLVRHLS